MENGFIKLYRKFTEWEWYDDINTCRLFVHLLIKANHKDKRWRGIEIKRGQYLTSRKTLSNETGLSEQQIRTSINKLKSTSEITSQPTSEHTIISITNYDLYQGSNQPSNQRATSEQPASNQRATTTKNEKNEKNEKNNGQNNFEEFWLHYPANSDNKKPNKAKAKDIYLKIMAANKITHTELLNAVKSYANSKNVKNGYVCHASTWLNNERWNDEIQHNNSTSEGEISKEETIARMKEALKKGEFLTSQQKNMIDLFDKGELNDKVYDRMKVFL